VRQRQASEAAATMRIDADNNEDDDDHDRLLLNGRDEEVRTNNLHIT
jgi:hypothetical protein